jgi:hypothetical protein
MRIGDRQFVKWDTGTSRRGDMVMEPLGVVVMPNLLQVYGPARVNTNLVMDPDERRRQREFMAARARRRRLPSALRYNPDRDPRRWQAGDDD